MGTQDCRMTLVGARPKYLSIGLAQPTAHFTKFPTPQKPLGPSSVAVGKLRRRGAINRGAAAAAAAMSISGELPGEGSDGEEEVFINEEDIINEITIDDEGWSTVQC